MFKGSIRRLELPKEEPPRQHRGDEAALSAESIGFSCLYLVEAPGIEP